MSDLLALLDPDRIPGHVAIIMDGNGRWANARGLHRTVGHARGEPALFDVVHGALELGIEWLTVYTFSTENSVGLGVGESFNIDYTGDVTATVTN